MEEQKPVELFESLVRIRLALEEVGLWQMRESGRGGTADCAVAAIRRIAALETALRVLVPMCIDALREAEGIDAEDFYDELPKAGLIEHAIFDPEKHGEIDGAEPGNEIWVLTDLGKEFAEAKVGEPRGGDTILGGDPILASLEAAAALCREAGCCCFGIHEIDPEAFDGKIETWDTGPEDGFESEIVRHDSRCPDALAARIEALALGKEG